MSNKDLAAIFMACVTVVTCFICMTDCNKHADTELTHRQAIVIGTNAFEKIDPLIPNRN